MITPVAPSQPAPASGEPPLRPAGGTLMGRNPLGMWVDAPRSSADFRHPWLVNVSGGQARVGKGYVIAESAVEPVIGKVPISGAEGVRPPSLKIDEAKLTGAGETWVCVEVTPGKDGKLTDKEGKLLEGAKVEVVQAAYPFATDGPKGRAPLALLVQRGRAWEVFQIAMFHLRYQTSQPADGPRRHFFL